MIALELVLLEAVVKKKRLEPMSILNRNALHLYLLQMHTQFLSKDQILQSHHLEPDKA